MSLDRIAEELHYTDNYYIIAHTFVFISTSMLFETTIVDIYCSQNRCYQMQSIR